jgi:murein DD-endopeptidase MepM/ murein hydrolase activator NlpD
MGERFKIWLTNSEISRAGDTYNPGPKYSDYDDFNVRKIQSLMGNPPDPAGKAYFGPKQWERLFTEGRPAGSSLPTELQGRVPPQLQTDPAPAPVPSKPTIPVLPASSLFVPGASHSSFTPMGQRFLAWLKSDEIHKAGSVYTPGPRYSIYDDRNVRAVQYLMGDTPDPVGKEFLGPRQWNRLFTESRPNRSLPSSLKPGGSGGTGGSTATNIPCAGRTITAHYGIKGSWAAGYHTGVDFGDRGDDTIRSVGAGTVVAAGWSGDWGRRVIVRHSNGRYSWYCHLASISVKVGQKLSRGSKVGMMGTSGRTFGKHLHYQESVGGYGYWNHKRPIMLGFGGY